MSDEQITYAKAGVDIDAANTALLRMKEMIKATNTPGVLGGVGSFGGMFQLDLTGYTQPVLVSSIDGVGTKLKIAIDYNKHDSVGKDIVNHCINDILVQGAKPLFFMDYFATGKLNSEILLAIISGMSEACQTNGVALLGGETAEMPGLYGTGDYDLAGNIVGIVERDRIITGQAVEAGDAIVGLGSNGLHTNGFSLARYVLFEHAGMKVDEYVPELEAEIGDALLTPHRCYLNALYPALGKFDIHAMAHITGGGCYDNIPRVLPSDTRAVIDRRSWEIPAIFRYIQQKGNIVDHEMFRSFNMGIGMVVILPREQAPYLIEYLNGAGEQAVLLGDIQRGGHDVQIV